MRVLTLLLTLLAALPCLAWAAVPPNVATFSVVAYDPNTGEVGVAVQSKFFAVGSVVPYAKAGVGAVASQAYADPRFGPDGLELLSQSENPTVTLLMLLGHPSAVEGTDRQLDPQAAQRQLGIVSIVGTSPADGSSSAGNPSDQPLLLGDTENSYGWVSGRAGQATTYTGGECMDWAGGIARIAPDGVIYAVQGNILTGPEVVEAMAAAMDDPATVSASAAAGTIYGGDLEVNAALARQDFAGRLLAALVAGQLAGGDSRGMQSAALLVAQQGAGYGGYTDRKYDLRVDDAEDPFIELARLLNLARPIQTMFQAYNLLSSGEHARAVALFNDLVAQQPEVASHRYNLACGLSVMGRTDEALAQLRIALRLDPALKQAAQGDPDFANIRDTAQFAELTR